MAPSAVSPPPAPPTEASTNLTDVTSFYETTLRFFLNGTRVNLDNIDPEITLLEYLRGIGLTGTKLGCSEGGCGACTVVISQWNPTTKKIYHASVNACLAPLVSVDGKHVITVEGIGNVQKPHSVQERIAKGNGSQCGVSFSFVWEIGSGVANEITVLHTRYCHEPVCTIEERGSTFRAFH